MIVRILGEGQYSVPEGEREMLEKLDSDIVDAVDNEDEEAFTTALDALTVAVRRVGQAVADDTFEPSALVVPFADSTLEETKGLLADADDSSGSDDR
jgi:hypothetical protein